MDIWYRTQEWSGLLSIDNYTNNIDEYFRKVIDINGSSHNQMKQIFKEVDAIVSKYNTRMKAEIRNLNKLNNSILELF